MNRNFIFAVLSATIGSGFQHGYHTGVINVPQKVLQEWIQAVHTKKTGTPFSEKYMTIIWSTAVAMFSVGGILGGFLTASFAEHCGRKGGIIFNNFIVLTAILLLACSKRAESIELFIAGRFLVGVNAGLNGGLCQIYLIEIAPVKSRGAVASVYQLMIIISIFLSEITGFFLGTAYAWPFIFVVAGLPACFQLLTLPFCPESPKYLLINKDEDVEAAEALAWLRNTSDVDSELEELKMEISRLKNLHPVTCKRMVSDIALRTPLAICVVLMVGQQFCGINAVVYFSTEMFHDVGMGDLAIYTTMGVGLFHALASGVTLFLIDVLGRRLLLLIGFAGMAIDTVFLTLIMVKRNDNDVFTKYLCVGFVFLFIFLFAPGIGAVPWFITAELFHHNARPLAVSLTVPANWIANFVVAQAFLPLKGVIGYYLFLIFVGLDLFCFVFILLYLPETNQRTALEIIECYDFEYYEGERSPQMTFKNFRASL